MWKISISTLLVLYFTLFLFGPTQSNASRCPWDAWGSWTGPRPVTKIFLDRPDPQYDEDNVHYGEDYHTANGENLYPMEEGNIIGFNDSDSTM